MSSKPAGKKAAYYPCRPLVHEPPLTIENLKSRIQSRNANARVLPPKYAGCDGQTYYPNCCPFPPMSSCPCPPAGCCPPPQLMCNPCPQPMCYPPVGCCPPPQPMCPPCPPPICYPPPCPPMFCCPQPYYCPYPCMPPPNCCPPPPCLPPCPSPPPCPPCKPPCCDPCKPPGSKCCGAGATLICVPKGRKPSSNCGSSRDGENGSQRSELPPSYNNCNFYVSELPKGLDPKLFKGNNSSQRSSQQDEAECLDDCLIYGDEGIPEIKNYPAGDGKVVPPPFGYPGSQRSPWGGGGGAEGTNGIGIPGRNQKQNLTWGNDDIPVKSQQQQPTKQKQTNVFVRDDDTSPAASGYKNKSNIKNPRSMGQRTTATTNLSSTTVGTTTKGFDARVMGTGEVDVRKIGSGGTISTEKFATRDGAVGTTISYTTGFGRDTSAERDEMSLSNRTGFGGRDTSGTSKGGSRSMTQLSRGGRNASKSRSPLAKSQLSRQQSNPYLRDDNNQQSARAYPKSEITATVITKPSKTTAATTAKGFNARVDVDTGEVDASKVGSGGTLTTQRFGTPDGGVNTTISYTTGFGGDTTTAVGRTPSQTTTAVGRTPSQTTTAVGRTPSQTTGLGGNRSMTNLSRGGTAGGGADLNETVSKSALDKLSKYQGQGGTILKVIQPNDDDDANRFKGEGGGGTPLYNNKKDGTGGRGANSAFKTTTILPPPGSGRTDGRFWLPQTPVMCKPKKRRRQNFVPLCKTCLQNYDGGPEFDDCGLPAPQPNSRGGGFLHGRSATPSYSRANASN